MRGAAPFAGGWAISLSLLFSAVAAEGQGWVVEASAGAAEYDAIAGDVGTSNAILGVRREGPQWVSVAGGIPLDTVAVPWISAGGGATWSRWRGPLQLGVQAAAVGFGYRVQDLGTTGGGATLIGLPFLSYSSGIAHLTGRTGVMHYASVFDGNTSSRTIHDSSIRGALGVHPGVALVGEGRLVYAAEGLYPYAGGMLQVDRGRASGWLRAGRWMADELEATGWSVGGQVRLPGRLAVRASFAREPDDPLYWNGSRTVWSVGVSRAFGARTLYERPLPPREAFRAAAGEVLLRVGAEEVALASDGAIVIAGDFTGWKPVPMKLRDGEWQASFNLAPGVYRYCFQRPDGSWFLPASVQNRVDDGFGGVNGVLVVVES